MTDIWVCTTCHSINRQRNDHCYKCGAPQSAGADAGPDLRIHAAVANRAAIAYRSALPFGLVASVLILAVAAMGVVILIVNLESAAIVREQINVIVDGGTPNAAALDAQAAALQTPDRIQTLLLVGAVIAFALWLSRVVSNIPALGGGEPSTTPTKALIYPLIPIWNLIKVPGMLQDALYRVEPQAGGFFMVALAWFGLVGSWIISFLGSIVLGVGLAGRIVDAASTPGATRQQLASIVQSSIDQAFALEIVTSALIAMGAVVLVLLILRIERRSAARDAEIRAAVLGTTERPLAEA